MKRGRLLDISDCCIHVTHRCHDRQFLLKFACDRRNYVSRLRATSLRCDVEFLDYAITSNHVHLLLWAPSLDAVSEAMQFLQGVTARDYNRRKDRQGAGVATALRFVADRFGSARLVPLGAGVTATIQRWSRTARTCPDACSTSG